MDMQKLKSERSSEWLEDLCRKRPVRMVEGGMVMTGPCRLSFPSLDKPAKPLTPGAKPKYQAALLFPHSNIKVLYDALAAAVRANYPNVPDPKVMLNPKDKNHPLKDQGLKVSAADGGLDPIGSTYAGYVSGLPFINPKSGNEVPCFIARGGAWARALPEDLAPAKLVFYGGCWVEGKVTIFKSTSTANPGVALGLQGLWKLADDVAFGGGGGASAEDGGSASDAIEIEDPNSGAIVRGNGVAQNDWDAPSASDWG